MHKLKEAAANLRNYLGRDEHGIKLLDDVVNIANVLRKQVADLKEQIERDSRLKKSAQDDLLKAKLENQKMQTSLLQEQSIRQQREHDIKSLENEVANLQSEIKKHDCHFEVNEEIPKDVFLARTASLNRTIIRKMRVCPAPIGSVTAKKVVSGPFEGLRDYYVYNLDDIAENPTNGEQAMLLGQFVAILAMHNFPCIIGSLNVRHGHGLSDEDADKYTKPFIRWFHQKNIRNDHKPFYFSGKTFIGKTPVGE